MKKTVFILIFFLSTVAGISQGNFKPYGIFETGYESRQTIVYTSEYDRFVLGILPTYIVKPYFATLNFGATYKGFQLYTIDKTYFSKDRSIYFNPLLMEYKIGLSYSYKFLKIGYEHMCSHSIEAMNFSDMYDRVSVRFILFGEPKI
jgi:hypothetical protein